MCVALVCSIVRDIAYSQGQRSIPAISGEKLALIKSQQVRERTTSYYEFSRAEGELRGRVLSQLIEVAQKPSRDFNGSFALTLRLVKDMNIKEALDSLKNILDFELDPATQPHGGFG